MKLAVGILSELPSGGNDLNCMDSICHVNDNDCDSRVNCV